MCARLLCAIRSYSEALALGIGQLDFQSMLVRKAHLKPKRVQVLVFDLEFSQIVCDCMGYRRISAQDRDLKVKPLRPGGCHLRNVPGERDQVARFRFQAKSDCPVVRFVQKMPGMRKGSPKAG